MRLRNLFEAFNKEVAIIFGRFNPPHKGHRAAWEIASKSPVWYVGTNKTTVGPKDPLPYDVKVEAMKAIWPEIEGHILADTGWFTMAATVYQKHGDGNTLYVVTDKTDKEWIMPTMLKQNGQQGDHGYYNFKNIEWKEAPRLSSATDLRGAVMSGDRDAFSLAAGVSAETTVMGKPFFDLVAEYLLPEQEKEQARRAAIDAKKASAAAKKADIEAKRAAKSAPAESIDEARMSAAVRLARAADRQRAKSDASLARTPSSIPKKEEPKKQGVAEVKQRLDAKCWKGKHKEGTKIKGGIRVNNCVANEDSSNAIANTASRLANKDDGKVAKLRAAGDKRRDSHYMSTQIAKNDRTSKDQWGNIKKEAEGDPEGLPHLTKTMLTNIVQQVGKEGAHAIIKSLEWGDGAAKELLHLIVNDLEDDLETYDFKQEDAAGVGIITRQNSTVDVNKGTPRKNLKAFKLI